MFKIAFLFSGSGAQKPGMMRDICEKIPSARQVFNLADEISEECISETCFSDPQNKLNATTVMMPAVFTADMAAFAAISAHGITPCCTAGFSLGEWAALAASGIISFERALKLVRLRAEAMETATPPEGAGMAVIMGRSDDYVEKLCNRVQSGFVAPANYNCPGQITVSGTAAGLDELARLAQEEGTLCQRIEVRVPSHCTLMEPAKEKLAQALADVTFAKPVFPILPNATAEPTEDPKSIKETTISQLVRPVLFERTIRKMLSNGVNTFVGLGPGRTLTGFVRKTAKAVGADVLLLNVESMESLNKTIETLC